MFDHAAGLRPEERVDGLRPSSNAGPSSRAKEWKPFRICWLNTA
ncbi:hypothetical protein [Streptomyces sp. NPDC056013]